MTLTISIVIFLIIFGTVHYMKPSMFYTERGGIRHFGIGKSQKTIFPVWLFSIILAIVIYLIACACIDMPIVW